MFKINTRFDMLNDGESINTFAERNGVAPELVAEINELSGAYHTRRPAFTFLLLEELPEIEFEHAFLPIKEEDGSIRSYEVAQGGFSAIITKSMTDGTFSVRFLNAGGISGKLNLASLDEAQDYARDVFKTLIRRRLRKTFLTMQEYHRDMKFAHWIEWTD